jgi:hypothetical protein
VVTRLRQLRFVSRSFLSNVKCVSEMQLFGRIRRQIFSHAVIGKKLAHYEILSHIGSGGMGDVYQATDTKLGDGKRFLVVTSGVLTSSSPPLTVVVNWNAGLKK